MSRAGLLFPFPGGLRIAGKTSGNGQVRAVAAGTGWGQWFGQWLGVSRWLVGIRTWRCMQVCGPCVCRRWICAMRRAPDHRDAVTVTSPASSPLPDLSPRTPAARLLCCPSCLNGERHVYQQAGPKPSDMPVLPRYPRRYQTLTISNNHEPPSSSQSSAAIDMLMPAACQIRQVRRRD